MTYRVELGGFEEYEDMVNSTFHKAHTALVKKYAYLNPSRKKLRELWKQVYGVKIIIENDRWAAAEFNSEENYTIFLLRWS